MFLIKSKVNATTLIIKVCLVFSVFFLTLLIAPYYQKGDQFHYRAVYEGLYGLNIKDGFIFYTFNLDSKELVHFFLSWFASNLELNKDFFIACFNSLLAYSVINLMSQWRVSIWIISLILLTNYYFYVLYFAAERLKFGFIFLILSFSYFKYFYFFAFLSIISHMQILIIYGTILFKVFIKEIIKLFITFKIKKYLIFVIIALLIISFFFGEHLTSKFFAYYKERSIFDLFKIFAFFILSIMYAKKKNDVVIIFFPLFISVFLIGGERVNMIGYFIFLYYALPINKGFNLGIISTSFYFLFSSVQFTINILEYGNGFYEK